MDDAWVLEPNRYAISRSPAEVSNLGVYGNLKYHPTINGSIQLQFKRAF